MVDELSDLLPWFVGGGIGLLLGYFICRSHYDTCREMLNARKEGYEIGKEEGLRKGMRDYRKGVQAVMGGNHATVERTDPQTGGFHGIQVHEILEEVDERLDYHPD